MKGGRLTKRQLLRLGRGPVLRTGRRARTGSASSAHLPGESATGERLWLDGTGPDLLSPFLLGLPTHGRSTSAGREHGGRGAAVRHRTRNPVPVPKFVRSLTRCTEISEGSVMDVAHGEMVEAELSPAGAKRSAWRGASTTTNRPNATVPSRGTRIGATTSPSYEEVDF